MLDKIRDKLPYGEKVHFWTDGHSSQFKNKLIFSIRTNFAKMYRYEIDWSYFATSHGKSANDAIGDIVKRMVSRQVMARRAIVHDAESFANSNILVSIVTEEDIAQRCQAVDASVLWDNLPHISGTINIHKFHAYTNGEIKCRFHSYSVECSRHVLRKTFPSDMETSGTDKEVVVNAEVVGAKPGLRVKEKRKARANSLA